VDTIGEIIKTPLRRSGSYPKTSSILRQLIFRYASRLLAMVISSKTRTSPYAPLLRARFCNIFAKTQTFLCAIRNPARSPCSLSLHTRCTATNFILPPASTLASHAFESISSPTVHAQPPIPPLSPPADGRISEKVSRITIASFLTWTLSLVSSYRSVTK